jgi:hypothetical protein
MTTTETAYRLLRHCPVTDLAALSLSQAKEVMGAISVAVGYYFRKAPAVLRQTSASVVLAAPRVVNNLAVTAGALEVTSGSPFATAQRGSSLRIDGDLNRNEVVSAVGWLNPYQGTSGTRSATVYGDAVPIGTQLIENILSDPILLDQQIDVSHRTPLKRASLEHDLAAFHRDSIGLPTHYAIQPTGVSRGASSQFLIRVWPVPERQMVMRFECNVQPDMFDELALTATPLEMPFSDDQMETIILPLAEREMLGTTLLDEVKENIAAQIEARAARAESLISLLPKDHGKPRGRIYTPRGW